MTLEYLHGTAGVRCREYVVARICQDRKSTRLNSSHSQISYAVFCLKKKKTHVDQNADMERGATPLGGDEVSHSLKTIVPLLPKRLFSIRIGRHFAMTILTRPNHPSE